jgi:tetratricopeptide (TPR) repeat protein
MKKYILKTLLLLILISFPIIKADVKSFMQKGNEFYKNNQYQLAIDEYNKLLKQGYEGTSLFYNLGNAHYRLGKVGYAILYYEKALKLSPGDEDVKHNLTIVKLNLKDKVDMLPPFFIFNIWESLLASFTVNGWTLLSLIVFLLLLLCIVAYFFSRSSSQQRISFFSGVGVTVLLIFVLILLTVRMNKEYKIKDGIIVSNVVTVKSAPDNSSKDEFVIHEGLKVRLEDKVDNWAKIRLADGKLGWVLEENIRNI